ncbi:hypothetical protein SBI67_01325 [Mycolicibacterium sp. 120266]|uniref:hypothetical protein n=1 Tax=Mycolicibacterium sp. 120266 TaxID=3090601 RepID=UPI00299D4CAD|nr:hypothetical protein [Mycolicibacterium sp. 120266]MDX1870748.1 hypothetical protein [Mycolicibacterium sp. 120266]
MDPIIGSEAIASGALTRGELRWRYTAIYPNVYVPKGSTPGPGAYAAAAWLWSGRRGIIAGLTAAARYGVPWIASTCPIELIAPNSKCPEGVIVRNERIAVDEIRIIDGMPITTAERTSLDLARHLELNIAVEHLDALAAITGLHKDDVWYLEERYPTARGIISARQAIALMDAGSGSRWETRVRLMVQRLGGVPPPRTSIRVSDVIIAMGWPRWKVGIDCGPRPDDESDFLHRIGWTMVPALPQHTRASIIARARTAVWARAMPPSVRSAAPRSGTA